MAFQGEQNATIDNSDALYNNPNIEGLENWNCIIDPYQARTHGIPMPTDVSTPTDLLGIIIGLITSARSAVGFIWNLGMRMTEVIVRINQLQMAVSTLAKRVTITEAGRTGGGGAGGAHDRGYQNI